MYVPYVTILQSSTCASRGGSGEVRPRRIQHGGGESASGQSSRVLNEPELIYYKCFFDSRCARNVSRYLWMCFWVGIYDWQMFFSCEVCLSVVTSLNFLIGLTLYYFKFSGVSNIKLLVIFIRRNHSYDFDFYCILLT